MSEANEAGEGGEGEPAGKFRNARVPLTRLALLADLSPTEVGCFRLRSLVLPNSGTPEFGGER